jgi:Tol biopolymer transport system component
VYSLLDKTWKTYGDFCWGSGIGSKVFSPDGTKIAFTSQAASSSENRLCDFNPSVLQILDIATGKLTPVPYSGYVIENARLSWSPDGKYLAGEFWRSQSTSQIVVIDLESGSGKVIADGTDPSWSPDGDWIAYGDQMKQKCILIHPDGSGAKLVRDLSKRRGGVWLSAGGALWSPDEKKLLFDDVQVDSLGDVTILDLPSGKETKLPRRSRFVWGWAAERR